jgi:hypothetical protein
MELSSNSIQWNIQFTRLIHDWEVGELASFYKRLYDCKLRGEGKDKLWWVPSRKGLFEVKFFYRALSPRGLVSFPWKSVWKSFLGRVFGSPKLLLEWLSLFGWRFIVRSLL